MDAFRINQIPNPSAAEKIAEGMFQAGKSKAEIWQALVDKQVDAASATATVNAVVKRHEVSCSGCGMAVARSETTLSSAGEPLCHPCANEQQTAQMHQRASESAETHQRLRQCRRCLKAMRCVAFDSYSYRWYTLHTYTFQCQSCGHQFGGYKGTLPPFLVLMGGIAIVGGMNGGGRDGLAFQAAVMGGGFLVLSFFLYKSLIWLAYTEGGWNGGPG